MLHLLVGSKEKEREWTTAFCSPAHQLYRPCSIITHTHAHTVWNEFEWTFTKGTTAQWRNMNPLSLLSVLSVVLLYFISWPHPLGVSKDPQYTSFFWRWLYTSSASSRSPFSSPISFIYFFSILEKIILSPYLLIRSSLTM